MKEKNKQRSPIAVGFVLLSINVLSMIVTLTLFLQGYAFIGLAPTVSQWNMSSVLWLMFTILFAGGVTYNAFQIKYQGNSGMGLFVLNTFIILSSFATIQMLFTWWNFGTPAGTGGADIEEFISYAILPTLLLFIPICLVAPVAARHMREAKEMEQAGRTVKQKI